MVWVVDNGIRASGCGSVECRILKAELCLTFPSSTVYAIIGFGTCETDDTADMHQSVWRSTQNLGDHAVGTVFRNNRAGTDTLAENGLTRSGMSSPTCSGQKNVGKYRLRKCDVNDDVPPPENENLVVYSAATFEKVGRTGQYFFRRDVLNIHHGVG